MQIDLTQYVVDKWGPWASDQDAFSATELRLASVADGVTLGGPLRVRVSIQARNLFNFVGGGATDLEARDVFSYTLNIPPGRVWSYPGPRVLRAAAERSAAAGATRGARTTAAAKRASEARAAAAREASTLASAAVLDREALLGANAGFGISIRVAGADVCADPCASDPCRPVDPCAPKKDSRCGCGGKCGCGGGAHCGCGCEEAGDELPCDFATGRGAHLGSFFPSACEPCTPGAPIGMPPIKGPSLLVPAARGGTVRTRYFNGMFITKEDLWTDQNNNRIKHALMNRAMGQGVVWGLDVRLDGDGICVLPGYGVDCCGNDIVVSSPYRVAAEALVRDPAAAATLAANRVARMNLLLEYFECPEEPRPVHGDPCAPETVSCEMSRIRETARLRLIPPCDVDDSGPIKDFLNEVKGLRGDAVIGPLMHESHAASAIAPHVPFSIVVEGLDTQGVVGAATLQPKLSTDSPPTQTADAKGVPNRSLMTRARVTLKAEQNFTFVSGNVVKESPAGAVSSNRTNTTITFEDVLPDPGNTTPMTYAFTGWALKDASGTLSSASGTRITLSVLPAQGLRMRLHVEVGPTTLDIVNPPPVLPCFTEACDPEQRPRFPVAFPWLHADPRGSAEAADPKVIVLAILYALSTSKIVQGGPGAAPEVIKEQEAIARALNAVAWKVLYDESPADDRLDMVQALRRLFQVWCKSLLYPGPRCECGCDPHGVVIGCALVEGGRITMVDPWGGRRWVIHYPLLAYWGRQFGIQPFDAFASKLFDLICCIAHQFPSRDGVRVLEAPPHVVGIAPPRSAVVPLGASALIFEEPARVGDRLKELGVTAARAEELGALEFAARVVESLNRQSAAAPGGLVTLYTVAGVPQLNFVAPAAAARPGSTTLPVEHDPSRFSLLVRTTMSPGRSGIPPLLRDSSERLTRELLEAIALKPANDEARAARDALKEAGIASAADLLAADPQTLHGQVVGRSHAAGLNQLLEASEQHLDEVAKAVVDTVTTFATEHRAVSIDDLREPEAAGALTEALSDALKGTVSKKRVAAAVKKATGVE